MIKGSIQQEDMIMNLYAPNVRVPNFIKQTLKGETGSSTIWDVSVPYFHQ
jgi:hypothetical protein